MSSKTEQRKQNAQALADGYTKEKRMVEITSITLFAVSYTYNFIRLARFFVHDERASWGDFMPCFGAVVAGIFFSDFVSGVAHWGLDTWGATATPVFGLLIRSFREHHVDQMSITRHDFIETNGDNSMPCVPFLILMAFFCPTNPDASFFACWPVIQCLALSIGVCVMFTNQTHKMSHSVSQPPVVKQLMDMGLLLSPQHHRKHHCGEFDAAYCITTGWCNPLLDAIHFWRGAEWVVTKLTGEIPRKDDKKVLVE